MQLRHPSAAQTAVHAVQSGSCQAASSYWPGLQMEAERQKAEEEALQKLRQQAEARAARMAVPTDERYIPRPASPALERSPTPSPSPSRARQACCAMQASQVCCCC